MSIGWSLIALVMTFGPCESKEIAANPADYRDRIAVLEPGDTLVLQAGTYHRGLDLHSLHGTADAPITISGPVDRGAVFTADNCCNTVQLRDVSHLLVRNLTLDGAGTHGSLGVDARGVTHHVSIENLTIRNYGADQQVVAISTKGPAYDWIIRGNIIVGAGTGLYLGNSDGSAPFVRGLIEYNVIRDTLGYNLQIKHQLFRPEDVAVPRGASSTIIRHNVFSKASNANSGSNARPNVLVGHFPLTGDGSQDRYEIYGNLFYQNATEALFQGEGNVVLHDNLFVNSTGSAVNLRPHHDRPRNVIVYHNTVVARDAGIRLNGAGLSQVQRIVANAVFAADPISGPGQSANVTGSYEDASTFLVAPFAPVGALSLYPRPVKLLGEPVRLDAFAAYPDGLRDFEGVIRRGRWRGAYERSAASPAWPLSLSRKPGPTQH